MVHLPKITGNLKYRVFPSSHFLILLTWEQMKLWKSRWKRAGPALYIPVLSFVSLFFVVSVPPLVWCDFAIPCWLSMASLHTLLSPGVLLSSFSTKGTISSRRGFGDCHLSAGVQDKKRDQNSSVKWGTGVTWASKPPQALRNSLPKALERPPQCSPHEPSLVSQGQAAQGLLPASEQGWRCCLWVLQPPYRAGATIHCHAQDTAGQRQKFL